MSAKDDPTVPDQLKLYRRINPEVHMVHDENLDCCRVTSGAFGQGNLSVLLHDTLIESGRLPSQVVTAEEPYLVALTAGQARDADQGVCRLPNEDDCAHGEIIGSRGSRSAKRKLVRAVVWEVCPQPEGTGCEPPGGARPKT
jgi:hypothetical protein